LLTDSGPDYEHDEGDDKDKGDGGASNGQQKKPKTPQQRAGESMIKYILDQADGECYSFRL